MAGKPEMARLLMLRSKAAALLQERIDKPRRDRVGAVLARVRGERRSGETTTAPRCEKCSPRASLQTSTTNPWAPYVRSKTDIWMNSIRSERGCVTASEGRWRALSSIKNQLEQIDQDTGSDRALARRLNDRPDATWRNGPLRRGVRRKRLSPDRTAKVQTVEGQAPSIAAQGDSLCNMMQESTCLWNSAVCALSTRPARSSRKFIFAPQQGGLSG
jgi:hypothetical protein